MRGVKAPIIPLETPSRRRVFPAVIVVLLEAEVKQIAVDQVQHSAEVSSRLRQCFTWLP